MNGECFILKRDGPNVLLTSLNSASEQGLAINVVFAVTAHQQSEFIRDIFSYLCAFALNST